MIVEETRRVVEPASRFEVLPTKYIQIHKPNLGCFMEDLDQYSDGGYAYGHFSEQIDGHILPYVAIRCACRHVEVGQSQMTHRPWRLTSLAVMRHRSFPIAGGTDETLRALQPNELGDPTLLH